jgi:hypothetical protein
LDIIFIDQNKWIDFGRVEANKNVYPELALLYENLISAVELGKVIFPLTSSHIIETSKRNDPKSRLDVAMAQVRLSKGFVFRSRKSRLIVEMCNALMRIFGKEPTLFTENWVVATSFIQAFEDYDQLIARDDSFKTSWLITEHMNSQSLYLEYMTNSDDAIRREAHSKTRAESEVLINRIEQRILLYSNYPLAM